jgi:hypothetical protein
MPLKKLKGKGDKEREKDLHSFKCSELDGSINA